MWKSSSPLSWPVPLKMDWSLPSLISWELSDGLLTLNLSEQYGGLADVSLALADYCLVLTMSQIAGVDSVQIQSDGHTYHSRSHQTMTSQEAVLDPAWLPQETS